ncbi:MAG: Rid family hydrolase [Gammaproteobacteria bacterium]|jgi:enamine deaminase RidA (YjgF/YER057c/UK114 family)
MIRSFRGTTSGAEHYLSIEASPGLTFKDQVREVCERYQKALLGLELAGDSVIFRRIFLSDTINQVATVRQSPLVDDKTAGPVAVSIVQQAPVSGAKIALLAYHVTGPEPIRKRRLSPRHTLVEKSGIRHLWSAGLCAAAEDAAPTESGTQTEMVFNDLIAAIESQGGNLRDHCVRTWLYLKDVDVFYRDMVHHRTELFASQGLTADTHYIASTGIQGACAHRLDLVAMDAYSILDVRPDQIAYLNDFTHLCATKDYNVTFERATRVAYADRIQYFISGTASIDSRGHVVHPGDVEKQLAVALDNVEALLRADSANLRDMMYLIVYLRDPADAQWIRSSLQERLPEVPVIAVHGAVCRPEWLVEIEGVGIGERAQPGFPAF